MTTAYTPILKLALPVTGELNGTWGDVVNNNITSMVEQAVAGLATINTWTTQSHTLTTANGTTDEARCAILQCSGAPGGAATVICPALSKVYIIKNSVTGGYAVTLKTSAGTGVSVPNGGTALLYCDGTNVVSGGGLNGDVVGPASATDTAIATFDGVTGKLIKNNTSTTIAANVITALGFSGPHTGTHNGTVGATSPNTGAFTTVSATGAFTSTLATGSAPFVVASTTKVANLNVDLLDGADWSSPAAIGFTTPAGGAFTTLTASSTVGGAGFTGLFASPPALGSTARSTGAFTTLAASGVFTSTVATGTAPFTVSSTTQVANLNAATAGNALTVTTNANLTGAITSVGNASSLGSFTSAQLAGALTDETGTGANVFATSPTLVSPALGTPTALVGTNITGTATAFTASNVTTNANLTGPITSTGNATAIASQTGTGTTFVMQASPTLTTPVIGAATGTSLSVTGQLTSTVATGTAPLVVSSTTNVANLNASSLNGATFASPGSIGNTSAGSGAFTTLSASSTVSGAGFTALFASPPALGTTAPAEVRVTTGWAANLTLTDAATVAWNTATSQVATFTFVSSNRTIGAPTNLKNGAFYALKVVQNAGSNTLTWDSVFKWTGGAAPTLSTGAGAIDIFMFESDGTNMLQVGSSQGIA